METRRGEGSGRGREGLRVVNLCVCVCACMRTCLFECVWLRNLRCGGGGGVLWRRGGGGRNVWNLIIQSCLQIGTDFSLKKIWSSLSQSIA